MTCSGAGLFSLTDSAIGRAQRKQLGEAQGKAKGPGAAPDLFTVLLVDGAIRVKQ